jgi:hypothetical protein
MAEERILQKKFGNTGGTTEFGSFGSLAEGSPVTTKNLDTIQALDTFLRGWYGATGSASEPPRIEDMNGLFFLLFSQIRYILESGIPEWLNNAEQLYYANRSVVIYNGSIYLAIQGDDAGNTNAQRNPATETAWWRLLVSVEGAVNVIGAQTIAGIKTFTSIPVLPGSSPTSDNQATRKKYVDDLIAAVASAITTLEERTITVGNGLTGGGDLSQNRAIYGVDSSVSAKGVVQLNDATNSTSTTQAATANAVKKVQDNVDIVAETVSFAEIFDYVVDSNAKYQALCDGSVSAVNVFVREGNWSASGSWLLSDTGTRRIVGESGAKLIGGTSSNATIDGDSGVDKSDPSVYSITGLSVVNNSGVALRYCENISHCSITGKNYGIRDCKAVSFCTISVSASSLTGIGRGIYDSSFISGCISYAEGGSQGGRGYSYENCINLENCKAEIDIYVGTAGTEDVIGRGFFNCEYLSNCNSSVKVEATVDAAYAYGMYGCKYITNGVSVAEAVTGQGVIVGFGFYECEYISHGLGQGIGISDGRGFAYCEFVYAPSTSSSGTTSKYLDTNGVDSNSAL